MHDFGFIKKELGINLICLDETDSTNTYAKEKAVPLGSLVIAKKQINGRGRLGHEFFSPEGGIYFSYVPLEMSLEDVQLLTQKAGVCVCRALEKIIFGETDAGKEDVFFKLKWVNDIFVCDKKLCGILCEKTSDRVVVGIGLNLKTEGFPNELKKIAIGLFDPFITDRIEILKNIDQEQFYEHFVAETIALLNGLISEEEIKSEYLKRQYTLPEKA